MWWHPNLGVPSSFQSERPRTFTDAEASPELRWYECWYGRKSRKENSACARAYWVCAIPPLAPSLLQVGDFTLEVLQWGLGLLCAERAACAYLTACIRRTREIANAHPTPAIGNDVAALRGHDPPRQVIFHHKVGRPRYCLNSTLGDP